MDRACVDRDPEPGAGCTGCRSGTSASTFSPESAMTRAMLTQVLYSYAGTPDVSGSIAADTAFTNIPKGAYYENAVLWAMEEDILPLAK